MKIKELKALYAEKKHGYFFSPGAMRFFESRLCQNVIVRESGYYFVTSEQFVSSEGVASPRKYTVRVMDKDTGDIDDLPHDSFQRYASSKEAFAAIEKAIVDGAI